MNLIETDLSTEIAAAMDNVFDTFKRSDLIRFYKMPSQIVAVVDPNFNPDFDEFSTSFIDQEPVYEEFEARIWYEDRQEFSNIINGGEDLGVRAKQLYNRVKIQVKEDAFNYLKDTVKFTFLEEEYVISESWRRIGILGNFTRFQIILKRVI